MPHLDRREDLIKHCSMATSRDELFCKFAIQNGAWTREEAILFIKHYRATGEGVRFGDWAAAQGAIDATLAPQDLVDLVGWLKTLQARKANKR